MTAPLLSIPGPPTHASLCVLASSSRGNCSALLLEGHDVEDPWRRLVLIDAGLSPRRTREALDQVGAGGVPIGAILFTHLDIDHCHPGWSARMGPGPLTVLHRRHRGRADRQGMLYGPTHAFEDTDFVLAPGVRVHPRLHVHDDLGAVSYRVECTARGQSLPHTLAYATDVGAPTATLRTHLARADVLAIESNYCPRLQLASDRPDFLKHRIMHGRGHLSNQQSACLAREAAPRRDLVLLHLSAQCNTPELALREHHSAQASRCEAAGQPMPRIMASSPAAPTPWIMLASPSLPPAPPTPTTPPAPRAYSPAKQAMLWDTSAALS